MRAYSLPKFRVSSVSGSRDSRGQNMPPPGRVILRLSPGGVKTLQLLIHDFNEQRPFRSVCMSAQCRNRISRQRTTSLRFQLGSVLAECPRVDPSRSGVSARARFGSGCGVSARARFGSGCGVSARARFRSGCGVSTRARFGSGCGVSTRARFGSGSGAVLARFGSGCGVSARGRFGSGCGVSARARFGSGCGVSQRLSNLAAEFGGQ